MNKFMAIGNLTKDPEIGTTRDDIKACRFSIAINREYGEETDFFNVISWRGTAEVCAKYLKKGHKVAIIGRVQNRQYETQDGQKRTATEIVAESVEFLTPKSRDPETESPIEKMEEITEDDLPF